MKIFDRSTRVLIVGFVLGYVVARNDIRVEVKHNKKVSNTHG